MKKPLKWTLAIILILAVGIQFFRPDRDNPKTDPTKSIWADTLVPAPVKLVLKTSCADCHSNETIWPWYTNVAPVSWLVAGDVHEGRAHMNLSTWADWTEKRRTKRRGDIVEETQHGDMPLESYTLMHPGAKLTAQQLKALVDWNGGQGGVGSEQGEQGKDGDD